MFEKITTVETITNKERTIKVQIEKFMKVGTKRIFFAPTFEGKRITQTMYARKYDAVSLGRQFFKYKQEKVAA